MPASRAAWIVAMLSVRSARPYVPDLAMQPRPTADTEGPSRPRIVFLMHRIFPDPSARQESRPCARNSQAMKEQQASRTLLKSPPELWAECSDAQSLARHLGEFGEIRIKELEPESTVAWEGDRTSGTVKLEPSGWGTRVTLTCSTPVPEEVAPEPEPEPEDRPEREPEPLSPEREAKAEQPRSAARGGLFKRVMRFLAGERAVADPIAPGSAEKPAAGA